MSKQLFGFCEAGCKYEVVGKEEYDERNKQIEEMAQNYLPLTGGTMLGSINLGKNHSIEGKTSSGGNTYLFGLVSNALQIGATSLPLLLNGKENRLNYNGNTVAFQSDLTALENHIAALETRLAALETSIITIYNGTTEPTSDVGEDGDIYIVTE